MRKQTSRLLRRSGTFALLIAGQTTCLAQAAGTQSDELETVTVTGTRIPQLAKEGPSPVFVQTREQLEAQGFTTVYEALKSFSQMTGVTQNDQYADGFTPNANSIDMRGLGPGRTLILLDGRRMTDYPLPYNGESNFVNTASIPAAAIERIEVLSGGASAIYGSDAVAGVVNIILRKNIDTPLDVNVRTGGTTQGGGKSTRIQGVGGFQAEGFKLTYAAEFLTRDPLYGYQREFMDSVADNPDPAGRIAPRAILRGYLDLGTFANPYFDPGSATCSTAGFEYSFRPGRGYYCGQSNYDAQQTVRNGRKQGSLYTNASWELGGIELFGSMNYVHSNSQVDDGFSYWTPILGDYIYNSSSGLLETLQRFFLPSEQGGRDARANKFTENSWDLATGARGGIDGTSWKYEFSLSHSRYDSENRVRRLLFNEVENYFLGPVIGTDPFYNFYPAYANVNLSRLYAPMTPTTYNQLSAIQKDRAHSSNTVVSMLVTGNVLELPAGPLALAGIVEWGTQKYDIELDPRYVAGDFWGITGTGGGGKRNRYASGVELSIPIIKQLRASLAGRYDKYDDVTRLNDAVTYKAGLEYRPSPAFLLRGSMATSFRAPDMHYVFADPRSFYDSGTDEYLCRRNEPNTSLSNCTNSDVNFQGESKGNRNLTEETGKSFTVGFVIEPLADFTMSVDYYHIDLNGLVVDYPIDRILRTEADCRLGRTAAGAAVNINSNECREAIARVRRHPADGTASSEKIEFVTTGPINTARYYTSGFDAGLAYKFPATGIGRFGFETTYSHVLKYDTQDFAGDPVKNHRDFPERPGFDLRSHIRSSVNWRYERLDSTVFMERIGSIPNWAGTGRIAAQTYFNLTANYAFPDDHTSLGVVIDNLLDRDPPRDPTYNEWPYYSTFNYSPVGREWFLELRYKF